MCELLPEIENEENFQELLVTITFFPLTLVDRENVQTLRWVH